MTCKRTGCSGEICSDSDKTSICTWNNSFSCYNQARCEYQPASGKCGWTQTPALSTCQANPPKPANATLAQQQSANNKTITWTMANVTKSVPYNVTATNITYKWDCHCNNTRFPSVHIESPPISQAACGCANSSQCSCCIDKSYVDQLFYSTEVCSANQTAADCQCNYGKANSSCACTPLGSQFTYKGLVADTTKCACINQTASQQNCRCCLAANATTALPKAPACNATVAATRQCECEDFVNSLGKSNLKCQCKNASEARFLTPSQCACLNYSLGASGKNQYSCNCCLPHAFQCPSANQTL